LKERIQKIISRFGLASRRTAEQWITSGRVRVNGRIVTRLGSTADPEVDSIEVNGRKLTSNPPQPVYLMLNKPARCVTTSSDPRGRPTVMHLLKRLQERVFPVGRLDFNSTGLLLLTNDGALARKLEHPSFGVRRVYEVKIRKPLEESSIEKLRRGIVLSGKRTLPCEITVLRTSTRTQSLRVTLREGRNRQIHRMMAVFGREVIRLKRVRFGPLRLGDLPPGKFRQLTPTEVRNLRESVSKPGSVRPKKASRPTSKTRE